MTGPETAALAPIEKLGIAHNTELFDCGKEELNRFYEHYDFDAGPADPYQLFLVMKDLKRLLS